MHEAREEAADVHDAVRRPEAAHRVEGAGEVEADERARAADADHDEQQDDQPERRLRPARAARAPTTTPMSRDDPEHEVAAPQRESRGQDARGSDRRRARRRRATMQEPGCLGRVVARAPIDQEREAPQQAEDRVRTTASRSATRTRAACPAAGQAAPQLTQRLAAASPDAVPHPSATGRSLTTATIPTKREHREGCGARGTPASSPTVCRRSGERARRRAPGRAGPMLPTHCESCGTIASAEPGARRGG